ncbi:MAG: MBL fold metallo-hydrolase [Candidatus Paceibacterota bacterium]|jgi:hypothetical protein
MIISYHGKAFIKVQQGDLVAAFNPLSKDSKMKTVRFGADLAMISLNHKDFNGAEMVSYANKTPFVIDGPGEYEVGGNFILGISSNGPEDLINTIYTFTIDNIRFCHLGAVAETELKNIKEEIGGVDVLCVPIGDNGTLKAKEAFKLANSLEPSIIIPILSGENDENLKVFLKEAGTGDIEATDKLTLKRKDLDGKEGEVVVLKEI